MVNKDTLSEFSRTSSLLDTWQGGTPISVNVIRLDDYMGMHDIHRVDFFKIDVEGAELEALEGAAKTLDENPEIILLVEFYAHNAFKFGHELDSLETKLREIGFQLFSINVNGIFPYEYIPDFCQNVIAVRQLQFLLRNLAEKNAARLLINLANYRKTKRE